jgi:hypothetical protein
MKNLKIGMFGLLAALFFLICHSAMGGEIPLPEDIKIIPPAPHIPSDVAALAGPTSKWRGQCSMSGSGPYSSATVEVIIIVESIDTKEINIIYASEGYSQYNMPSEWQRLKGEIATKKGRTSFSVPLPSSGDRSATGKFWIKDGILVGERTARTGFGSLTSTFKLKSN